MVCLLADRICSVRQNSPELEIHKCAIIRRMFIVIILLFTLCPLTSSVLLLGHGEVVEQ